MAETRRCRVEVERSVERSFRRLPHNLLIGLLAAIRSLENDPRPPGCRNLDGQQDAYRVRVGDWRIIYRIHEDRLVVVVIEAGPRGSVCQRL